MSFLPLTYSITIPLTISAASRARFLSIYESDSPCPTNIDTNSFNISVSDNDTIFSCFTFSHIFVENTHLFGKFSSLKLSIQ